MAVPEGVELDSALVDDRRKYGVDPEPEPLVSSGEKAVATDGGQLIEAKPKITTHIEPSKQRSALYYRCEGCGVEIVEENAAMSNWHNEGCPNAEHDGDG